MNVKSGRTCNADPFFHSGYSNSATRFVVAGKGCERRLAGEERLNGTNEGQLVILPSSACGPSCASASYPAATRCLYALTRDGLYVILSDSPLVTHPCLLSPVVSFQGTPEEVLSASSVPARIPTNRPIIKPSPANSRPNATYTHFECFLHHLRHPGVSGGKSERELLGEWPSHNFEADASDWVYGSREEDAVGVRSGSSGTRGAGAGMTTVGFAGAVRVRCDRRVVEFRVGVFVPLNAAPSPKTSPLGLGDASAPASFSGSVMIDPARRYGGSCSPPGAAYPMPRSSLMKG